MLATAFVSVLLLSVAMVAVQAGKIYNRGTVMKTSISRVGQLAMLFVEIFKSSATKIVNSANPVIVVSVNLDRSGRTCAWDNIRTSGTWFAIDDPVGRSGKGVVRSNGQAINLARVLDEDAALCQSTSDSYPMDIEPSELPIYCDPLMVLMLPLQVMTLLAVSSRVTSANNSEALYAKYLSRWEPVLSLSYRIWPVSRQKTMKPTLISVHN